MWLLKKNKNKVSARCQIRIKEVRDDILVLPDSEYRSVIETSSVNFELKSDEEQDVLIDSFQNFLNSLPCKLQILVRVREVDIDRYLEGVSKKGKVETEKVYRNQITNYCSFIRNLVEGNKILSRRFFIVVPYKHTGKNENFPVISEQMHLQRDIILKGLEKLGMKTRVLGSLELLDLFYSFYNPEQVKTQELREKTIEMLLENSYV